MSSHTWSEFLAEARDHLSASRIAAETGSSPPVPPELPMLPIPEEFVDEARELAFGYDQLAAEVAERMAAIERRFTSIHRSPHQEDRPASYVDTAV